MGREAAASLLALGGYMKTYKLKDPIHPDGGITIKVKHDEDCVFCQHCERILWDYTHLIYHISCELNCDVSIRPCEKFLMEE